MAPHSPYLPPEDLRPGRFRVRVRGSTCGTCGPACVVPGRSYFDLGVYHALYAAEVRSADRLAGRLLDGLATLDRLDRVPRARLRRSR